MNQFKFFLCLLLTQVIALHYQTKDHKLFHLEISSYHKKSEPANELAQLKILNQYDMSYLVELKIGSKNNSYLLSVDTGSSDFVISSSECQTCQSQQSFDCSSSETCKENIDEKYEITYGDGYVSTHIAYDDIILGNMASKHQSFLLADLTAGEISMSPEILGIGPDNLSVNKHKSLINNLIKQKKISHNIFSIYLKSNYAQGSKIILGGYDTQYFMNPEEQIYWFPIQSLYSYSIDFSGIEMDGNFIQLDYQNAILDTGSSAMTFPEKEIQKIISVFQEQYDISCKIEIEQYNTNYGILNIFVGQKNTHLPEISFKFSDKIVIMKPEDYIYFCAYDYENDQYVCETKFEAQFYGESSVILGDGFMQTFYTIFDKENQSIGIVRSNNLNKIFFTIDKENVIAVKEIQKLRADKKFNQKQKVVVLGGVFSIPLLVLALQMMKKKKVIGIGKNQMSMAFGGIFLAASFTLCFYLTTKVDLK